MHHTNLNGAQYLFNSQYFIYFLSMIESVNINLKNYLPGYQRAVNLSMKTIQTSKTTASSVIDYSQKKVELVKAKTMQVKQKVQLQISNLISSSIQQALNTVQSYVYKLTQLPTQQEKKQLKKRLEKFYKKIVSDYLYTYGQRLTTYNLALVKKGKQYVYINVLPLYIHLKATLIVTKELMIEMLQSRLDGMKMSYSVSKDTVTMMIGGKFDEEKIIEKVSQGMDNFKDLTVKVVKRGLQIKVDKKSLYQNYQIFSLKLLQVIRQMREKSAQSIVTARQKTSQMYKSVINRIKQREVLLKMEYKEIQDQKE